MTLRLIRRIALGLIAVLAFAQASVVLAACSMERGAMASMLEMPEGCGSCEPQADGDVPQNANRCVAHCTADLQLSGSMTALVRSPAHVPVLLLPPVDRLAFRRTGLDQTPPGAPPHRILLHSFLI
jgi:hypothetical protein